MVEDACNWLGLICWSCEFPELEALALSCLPKTTHYESGVAGIGAWDLWLPLQFSNPMGVCADAEAARI